MQRSRPSTTQQTVKFSSQAYLELLEGPLRRSAQVLFGGEDAFV